MSTCTDARMEGCRPAEPRPAGRRGLGLRVLGRAGGQARARAGGRSCRRGERRGGRVGGRGCHPRDLPGAGRARHNAGRPKRIHARHDHGFSRRLPEDSGRGFRRRRGTIYGAGDTAQRRRDCHPEDHALTANQKARAVVRLAAIALIVGTLAAAAPATAATLFITNTKGESASVIETDTLEVVGTIHLGQGKPNRIVFPPDGKTAWVVYDKSHDLGVIDAESRKLVKRVKIGGNPYNLAFTPDGRHLLVLDWGSDTSNDEII